MASVEEQRFIQAGEVSMEDKKAAGVILRNFILFALCFSLSLGTVTASIPLATSQFGKDLGSYSLGTLYSLYTVAAMFLSVPLLDALGTKTALIVGQVLYAVYVGSYLLGREIHDSTGRWLVVLFGAAIGGVAAGLVWPAQQGYFTKCAAAHAKLLTPPGLSEEEIAQYKGASTARMSSVFATVYLGIEVLMKILSSLIQLWTCIDHWNGDFLTGKCEFTHPPETHYPTMSPTNATAGTKSPTMSPTVSPSLPDPSEKNLGQIIVFALYLGLSITACFLMLIVPMPKIGEETKAVVEDPDKPKAHWLNKSKDAVTLMYTNPKILLMSGVNMAFGGTAAYLNSYVTGTVIKDSLGQDKVGYFVSIIPLLASIESIPFGKFQECIGTKVPIMIFGLLCFGGFAMAFAVVDEPVCCPQTDSVCLAKHPNALTDSVCLGKWSVLPALFCIFATGRAAWEGPNKAVTADFFPGEDGPKAGANVVFQNGLTSAVAFYVYPNLSSRVKSIVCVCFSAWGIIGYLIAHGMFKAERARKAKELRSSDHDIEQTS